MSRQKAGSTAPGVVCRSGHGPALWHGAGCPVAPCWSCGSGRQCRESGQGSLHKVFVRHMKAFGHQMPATASPGPAMETPDARRPEIRQAVGAEQVAHARLRFGPDVRTASTGGFRPRSPWQQARNVSNALRLRGFRRPRAGLPGGNRPVRGGLPEGLAFHVAAHMRPLVRATSCGVFHAGDDSFPHRRAHGAGASRTGPANRP